MDRSKDKPHVLSPLPIHHYFAKVVKNTSVLSIRVLSRHSQLNYIESQFEHSLSLDNFLTRTLKRFYLYFTGRILVHSNSSSNLNRFRKAHLHTEVFTSNISGNTFYHGFPLILLRLGHSLAVGGR